MPRQRPSADRILEAAERVLTREGYGETSLRQLMTAAGVSTTAFYARFASKEDVLNALVARLLEELATAARAELAEAEHLEDGFRRGVDVLHAVLSPKKKLVRIALTEAAASREVTQTLGRLYGALAGLLATHVRALAKRNGVTGLDADAIAWGVVGALNMQILRWAVYEQVSTQELRDVLRATAGSFLPVLQPVSAKKRRPRAVAS